MVGGLAASRWANAATMPSHSRSRVTPSSIFPSSRLDDRGRSSENSRSSGSGNGNAPSTTGRPSPQQELSRFLKIVSRIRWKLPFLDYGYKLATEHRTNIPAQQQQQQQEVGVKASESEIHFKIDFYEFYMHLERAIVHLLGVYGVAVYPSASASASGAYAYSKRMGWGGQHQYHVNVLLALDDPSNPLHAVLGQGEARRQLWSAKDLRNRWKTADSDAEGKRTGRYTVAPLEAYNLELMLQVILAALEEAYVVTVRFVEEEEVKAKNGGGGGGGGGGVGNGNGNGNGNGIGIGGSEEQDWGFIADAMDWEAV